MVVMAEWRSLRSVDFVLLARPTSSHESSLSQGETPPAQGATVPKATSCKLYGQIIGVDEALHLRDEASRRRRPYPPFRCRECEEFVRPHKRGTTDQAAHFEHRESSPGCPLGA